jgi:hypothetical protein
MERALRPAVSPPEAQPYKSPTSLRRRIDLAEFVDRAGSIIIVHAGDHRYTLVPTRWAWMRNDRMCLGFCLNTTDPSIQMTAPEDTIVSRRIVVGLPFEINDEQVPGVVRAISFVR